MVGESIVQINVNTLGKEPEEFSHVVIVISRLTKTRKTKSVHRVVNSSVVSLAKQNGETQNYILEVVTLTGKVVKVHIEAS